ncbi:hypothetical protein NG895_19950 [Aeoliella sp. ICT_H6.2]|uniref:Uncharacterized protein n=1 Tax=Aeoliella straminimaris TaxID=2954799 RepID=A0A9X2FCR7_9BACT|nr:hypothetical protein [Aeoliella straminimaris]MCO6046179.1 hypothetical protein [Aeoliella straminimaris]
MPIKLINAIPLWIITALILASFFRTRLRARKTADSVIQTYGDCQIGEDLLMFEYKPRVGGRQHIAVDPQQQQVSFGRCFYPSGFWVLGVSGFVACSFDDILEVHRYPDLEGGWITQVLTTLGKAQLSLPAKDDARFRPLRETLTAIAESTPNAAVHERPGLIFAASLCLAAGIIAAIILLT